MHLVGLPTLDHIMAGRFTQPERVRAKYGINQLVPLAIYCIHPVGGHPVAEWPEFKSIHQVIHICSNGDAGSDDNGIHVPRADFHGLLNIADVFVGNSSAAVKEAPMFGCKVIEMGDRQKGRYRGNYYFGGAGAKIAEVLATAQLTTTKRLP